MPGARRPDLKTLIRTVQTRFPGLVEAKATAQRTWRRLARVPFEDDFRIIAALDAPASECLVDIGANRGQSIEAMRLFDKARPIVAFEANPALADVLVRRYQTWPDVTILPLGLADMPGQFDLVVPYYRGFMFDGLASFDETAARSWLNAERIIGFDERHLELRRVACKVGTLDAERLEPALIKIDVQGFERQIIEGGQETLGTSKPVLIVEVGTDDGVDGALKALGYRRYGYTSGRLITEPEGVRNSIFVHPERDRGLAALIA